MWIVTKQVKLNIYIGPMNSDFLIFVPMTRLGMNIGITSDSVTPEKISVAKELLRIDLRL